MTSPNNNTKPKNPALWLIWIILFLIIIFVIYLVFAFTVQTSNPNNNGGGPIIFTPTTYCSDDKDIPDVSDLPFCPGDTLVKYDSDLLMTITPAAIPYQQLCRSFCPSGMYDSTSDTCSTTDQTILQNFNNCISATKPIDCTGVAKPIAISNNTPYYGQTALLQSCYT